MRRQFNNTVVILGGDHHNTLSAIRCFGRYGYEFKVGIITKQDHKLRVSGSKYAKGKIRQFKDDSTLVNWLLELGISLSDKGIIVSCSDLSEYIVDSNAEILSKYYHVPGFKGKPGNVKLLMNKYKQKQFAEQHKIKMAKTWLVELDSQNNNDITIPCIIKPNVSAFGSKSDIKKVFTREDLNFCLNQYAKKGYKTVLCQELLNKKYEVCAFGYIPADNSLNNGVVIKKIHENEGGSTAYAQIIDDKDIFALVNKISNILKSDGYNGLYDYEFLVCNDGIYLNEINFRQSGNEYATINWGAPSPLNWALSTLGISPHTKNELTGKYHMDDFGELIALKNGKISIIEFLCEFLKCRNCSVFNVRDIAGTFSYYKRTK